MEKNLQTSSGPKLLIKFDLVDQITRSDIEGLLSALGTIGAHSQIKTYHSQMGMLPGGEVVELLGVLTSSLTAISAVLVFMYSTFKRGVVIDMTGETLSIYKNDKLPRGSVLLLRKNGQEQFFNGLTASEAADLVNAQLRNSRS